MNNYIVLVKQVPDISQITDNAFDPESGTLIRSRLGRVINELDSHALGTAYEMRSKSSDESGKIVCLSMGPETAEEVLRYGLSRCADSAVLLTDRELGGADTWATANTLAFAIRRIAEEQFGGKRDYYVLCGMQSVDGDTAQVPGQLAEELGAVCAAYVTGVSFVDGRFEFTRIKSGGSEVVSFLDSPAVITVAKHEYPLYASFSRTRLANSMEITRWGADDIKATHTGVKGSKTAVIRVFAPGKSKRKCRKVSSAAELAKLISSSFNESGDTGKSPISEMVYKLPEKRNSLFERNYEGLYRDRDDFERLVKILNKLGISDPSSINDGTKDKIISLCNKRFHKGSLQDMLDGLGMKQASYSGEVWVAAEHKNAKVNEATFELIGKARELADSLCVKVGVVLAGAGVSGMIDGLIMAGADTVYGIEDGLPEKFDTRAYCKAVSDCVMKYQPQILLFGATVQGRVLAPMVSYRCGCGLTADCTELSIGDNSRRGQIGILFQTRPALGGNVMATICTKNSFCQMATARPGVMKRLADDPNRCGKVIRHRVSITKDDVGLEIIKDETQSGESHLDAEIIVSGGKGMQNRDNYERLIGQLCESLESKFGVAAARGASRSAVEQGFAERLVQVGQTGTSVGPKVYVAVGISGAIQHMIGVANAGTIVAINSDPEAPIFKNCDYYITGTAEAVIPELVQALKA